MTTPSLPKRVTKDASPSASEMHEKNTPRHLLTIRAAMIFMIAILVGLAAGILTFMAGTNTAQAALAGGVAFGGTLGLANTIIA